MAEEGAFLRLRFRLVQRLILYRGRIVHDNPSAVTLSLLQHQLCGDSAARLEMALAGRLEDRVATGGSGTRGAARLSRSDGGVAAVAAIGPALRDDGDDGGDARPAGSRCWRVCCASRGRFQVRRPPTDPVNALLSRGYTFLLSRTVARCEALGLEVLHAFRSGRPSLACDLMEPLRLPAADRRAIELCNEGRLEPSSFVAGEDGGIRLHPWSMGRTISTWEEDWQNGGHECELDRLLTAPVERLRIQSPRPGSPLTEERGLSGSNL